MPHWTAHQIPPPPTRPVASTHIGNFQRFLGLYSSRTTSPAGITNPYTIHRSQSAPPGRAFPRFRPPRSVYGGLDQHPFNRAPFAKAGQSDNLPSALRPATPVGSSSRVASRQTPGREVRFTPSTTAQSDEHHIPQDTNRAPITPERNNAGSARPLTPGTINSPTPPKQNQCPHRTRQIPVQPLHFTRRQPGNQYIRTLPYVLPSLPFDSVTSPPPLQHLSLVRSRRNVVDPSAPFEFDFNLNPSTPTSQFMSGSLMDPSPFPSPQTSPTSRQHLIEQFPIPPSSRPSLEPQPPRKCWRCKISNLAEMSMGMAAKLLRETRNVLCLVCCGYDCDDTSTARGSAFGSSARLVESPARTATSAPIYPSWQDLHGVGVYGGTRRDVLNSTPVVGF
jgi:hypothetical protein